MVKVIVAQLDTFMTVHPEHEFEVKWDETSGGWETSSNAPEKIVHAHTEQIEDETKMIAEIKGPKHGDTPTAQAFKASNKAKCKMRTAPSHPDPPPESRSAKE